MPCSESQNENQSSSDRVEEADALLIRMWNSPVTPNRRVFYKIQYVQFHSQALVPDKCNHVHTKPCLNAESSFPYREPGSERVQGERCLFCWTQVDPWHCIESLNHWQGPILSTEPGGVPVHFHVNLLPNKKQPKARHNQCLWHKYSIKYHSAGL